MGTLRFFTPALYRRMQSERFDPRTWDKAGQRYAAHIRQALRGAPEAAEGLARSSFHDCLVQSIAVDLERSRVVMELSGMRLARGKRAGRKTDGKHRVEFRGVGEVGAVRGGMQYWLYGEVHAANGAGGNGA